MNTAPRQSGAFILATVIFMMVVGAVMLYSMTNLSQVTSSNTALIHNNNTAKAAAQSGLNFVAQQLSAGTPPLDCSPGAYVSADITPHPCDVKYANCCGVESICTVSSKAVCGGSPLLALTHADNSPTTGVKWLTVLALKYHPVGGGDAYQLIPASRRSISMFPQEGPAAGGTVVTLWGFPDATDVLFNGVSGGATLIPSDQSVTATTPVGAGTVTVTVVRGAAPPYQLPGAFKYN